jgi:hypothetical protein
MPVPVQDVLVVLIPAKNHRSLELATTRIAKPANRDVSAMVLFMLFYVLFITILCINSHIEYKNK